MTMMDVDMDAHGLDHTPFDQVVELIHSTLSDQVRTTLHQHVEVVSLLKHLKNLCNRDENGNYGEYGCLRGAVIFARKFAPFFNLLSVYLNVKDEWMSWFWAMIRLVFEVGSDYIFFLEKIGNVFESLAHALPNYHHLHGEAKKRLHAHGDRICASMSYVYADVMQLCLDLYSLFYRRDEGSTRHSTLSSPLPIPSWRPLDSRLARLETQIVHHSRWIHSEIVLPAEDLEMKVARRRSYVEFLERQHSDAGMSNGSDVERRMARRVRRLDRIKTWISSNCNYNNVYEHCARLRYPGTCKWFLTAPEYCAWKSASFDRALANNVDELKENWHDRILFVQANPGFGKTFLSTAVIDDLKLSARDLSIGDDHLPPSTAYFHFNATYSSCTHPHDALRALAYQLIHTHFDQRQTIDALSLLLRQLPTHVQATSDEIRTVLLLLLRQHPSFLVIDGLDECNDVELFLREMTGICRKSDSRILLFSRPDIQIPLEYQNWVSDSPHVGNLADGSNNHDVQCYINGNLNTMRNQGFFGTNMDRSLISRVIEKSHGVFLWANLFIKFLQSPRLRPDERRDLLENIDEMEGLPSIHHHILAVLERGPEKDKKMAVNLFRWLSLSINRLCLPGLHMAATSPTAFEPSTSLEDFLSSIPHLTCGLVDVTPSGEHAIFTHRSVKDYLHSPVCQASPFSLFDEPTAHAHLAARCLSFLVEYKGSVELAKAANTTTTSPRLPTSTSTPPAAPASSNISTRTNCSEDSGYKSVSTSTSDSETISLPNSPFSPLPFTFTTLPPLPERHPHSHLHSSSTPLPTATPPFLRYATLCWPIHLCRALAIYPSNTPSQQSPPPLPWLLPLQNFLSLPQITQSWIQLSNSFNLAPNLSRLVPLMEGLRINVPPGTREARRIRHVMANLRELCGSGVLRGEFEPSKKGVLDFSFRYT